MSLKIFLEALSKWTPVKITIPVNIKNLTIGGKTFKVENGFLNVGDDAKLKIDRDDKGYPKFSHNDTEIYGFLDNKKENIKKLDVEEKVFTRGDITELQLGFLSIEEKHERAIKKLRPYLLDYRANWDLGALLIASTIIKYEDDRKDDELVKQYKTKLKTSYKKIGPMVYNLFRSDILLVEMIPHLEKLESMYSDFEEVKKNFLIYWYTIIAEGYPTAYFIQWGETEGRLSKEIKWRLDRGSKFVDVYSRVAKKNTLTKRWCSKFIKRENCYIDEKETKRYKLGFTPALKIRILPSD